MLFRSSGEPLHLALSPRNPKDFRGVGRRDPAVTDAILDGYIRGTAAQLAGNAAGERLPAKLAIGTLAPETLEALGIEGEARVVVSRGSDNVGVKHMLRRHAKELEDGSFRRILSSLLADPKARYTLSMSKGRNNHIAVWNDRGELLVLRRHGDAEDWEVVSAIRTDPKNPGYRVKMTATR